MPRQRSVILGPIEVAAAPKALAEPKPGTTARVLSKKRRKARSTAAARQILNDRS
jgi:hypothetical protein